MKPTAATIAAISLLSVLLLAAAAVRSEPIDLKERLEVSYLILRNGEVLRGKVVVDGDRYRVSVDNGQLLVKASDVETVCNSLLEAYHFKRSTIVHPQFEDHVALAHWCIRNDLRDQARGEIAAASQLRPDHASLQLLMRLVEPPARAPAPSEPAASAAAPAVPNPVETAVEMDRVVKSMPAGTVEAFTNSIQPLLMNSCGSAACHGSAAKHEFVLFRPGLGRNYSTRLTQRNLHAAMQLVDRKDLNESQLLTIPLRPHASMDKAILQMNSLAYQQLSAWVYQASGRAAADLARANEAFQSQATSFPAMQPIPADTAAAGADWPQATPGAAAVVPAPGFGSAQVSPQSVGQFQPRDPFDPEIFNRRYHRATEIVPASAEEPAADDSSDEAAVEPESTGLEEISPDDAELSGVEDSFGQ